MNICQDETEFPDSIVSQEGEVISGFNFIGSATILISGAACGSELV